MKLSHKQLIILSGTIWFLVGVFLLNIGLKLLLNPLAEPYLANKEAFMSSFGQMIGGNETAVIVTIVLALVIGFMKGRFVLGKSARQGVSRILSFPNPTSISNVYGYKYYILLGFMIGLGVLIKVLDIPTDIRGWIDTAIGAALINGAMIYYNYAWQLKSQKS
ncbi:MAG: hypothetical protein WC222_09650 [Parachlamydiales bacterium]|jgi:hypothetical protein